MSKTWTSLLFNTSEGGVSSAIAPELLPDNKNAWMLNGTNRGGKPATRPNIKWVLDLPIGLFQGGEFFGIQGGMMVFSIAGRIYRIRVTGNQFQQDEIPLTFPNSPVVKQVWMTQTVETLVIQDGQSNPILYNGSTAPRAVTGQVPRGRMMAYGNGRLWVAINANNAVAGDIRTEAAGTELNFTEATYLTGGGKLFFPSGITGMAFIPVTGQADYGALLVFGADATNAIRADITARDDWGKVPGFVTGILRSVGAASQWSLTAVNQDLYWRDSNRGIRSIRNALADETGPGSSPLSREVSRLTDYDSQRQLAFCSAVYHDNRLLMTSSPFLLPNGGVGFKNLVALDFAPLSTIAGKSQAAYDGQWSGLDFVKLVGGKFRGRNRAFVISTDVNGRNQLWELGTGNRSDLGSICVDGTADTDENRITSFIEYPQRDFGAAKQRKRLERCDVWLTDVNGEIDLKVYWRPDNSQQWLLWDEATTCAKTSDPATDAPHVWKNLQAQYRPQFKTFTIPADVQETVKYAAEVGFKFQIRLVWTGHLRIEKVMLHGTYLDDPDFADRSGFEIECVQSDVTGNEILYTIPNEGCSQCGEITTQPVSTDGTAGDGVMFSVENDGRSTNFQWQVSEDMGGTWVDVTNTGVYSGAQTRELTVSPLSSELGGLLFRCIMFGGGCLPAVSEPAELTVTCQQVESEPIPTTVDSGGTAQFYVSVNLPGVTFHWQVSEDNGGTWTNLTNSSPYSGVATDTLTIDPAGDELNDFLYRCQVGHLGCPGGTSGSAKLTVTPSTISVDYLLVGGGGGGGCRFGGGGGGGGVLDGTRILDRSTSYPVFIGTGGAGANSAPGYQGQQGIYSTFDTLIAPGGGGGGGGGDAGVPPAAPGGPGGCGGGGGGGAPNGGVGGGAPGGAGAPGGYGGAGYYAGGDSVASGGGGGSLPDTGGSVSVTGITGGDGGFGFLSSISGTPTYYAGGGGGSAHNSSGGSGGVGGQGGGGAGANPGLGGSNGAANTGGGGGGGDDPVNLAGHPGGIGGSGVLILSYAGAQIFTGGSITSVGGRTIHTFIASGTLAPI